MKELPKLFPKIESGLEGHTEPVLESNLKVRPRDRLKFKIIVFPGLADSYKFGTSVLPRYGFPRWIPPKKTGAVTCSTPGDRRFFGMVVFCADTSLSVIAHEAFHLACVYTRRVGFDKKWSIGYEIGNRNEQLAYTIGNITALITEKIQNIYERQVQYGVI